MHRITLAALIAAALSGCASLDGALANRISYSADGKQVLISSMYGPIGVTSKAHAGDAEALLAARPAAAAASAPAAR